MLPILQTLLQYIVSTLARVVGVAVFLFFVAVLLIKFFGIDYKPYLNESGRIVSGGRVVEFQEAFEGNSSIRVCDVQRVDADGDSFKEWLVYYQFETNNVITWKDPCPGSAPMAAAIYDNDRGKPAILFPYKLQPPDRDFLGEGKISVSAQEIVPNFGTETTTPIPELIFKGSGATKYMTIFKFQQNTAAWDSPTDEVPRYQVIGSFSGTGRVTYNADNKTVVVYDRGPFERSQLAVKTVYKLHGDGNNQTYMAEMGASSLAAPVLSTIDFGIPPPTDIKNAAFPEKIMLAFYQALTGSSKQGWKPEDFIATGSEAEVHLNRNDYAYFGFSGSVKPTKLTVRQLKYYPAAEQNPVSVTVEGYQPRRGRVDIDAIANQGDGQSFTGLISFEMWLVEGQWKINKRLK